MPVLLSYSPAIVAMGRESLPVSIQGLAPEHLSISPAKTQVPAGRFRNWESTVQAVRSILAHLGRPAGLQSLATLHPDQYLLGIPLLCAFWLRQMPPIPTLYFPMYREFGRLLRTSFSRVDPLSINHWARGPLCSLAMSSMVEQSLDFRFTTRLPISRPMTRVPHEHCVVVSIGLRSGLRPIQETS